jgi:hypothetical protein
VVRQWTCGGGLEDFFGGETDIVIWDIYGEIWGYMGIYGKYGDICGL